MRLRITKSTRINRALWISLATDALIDRVALATGEARGRVVDTLTHGSACACAVCVALRSVENGE